MRSEGSREAVDERNEPSVNLQQLCQPRQSTEIVGESRLVRRVVASIFDSSVLLRKEVVGGSIHRQSILGELRVGLVPE